MRPAETDYPYVWHWRSKLGDRKGARCRVICRGAMNSALVEFAADGFRVVTSRNALRRSAELRFGSQMGVTGASFPVADPA
jgi:hypothetical protein